MSGGAHRRHNGKHKGGGFGERFVGIPHSAYSSPLFVALSPWSIKLLVDLGAQYNGRNNGDLAAAITLMKPRGWNSETTLNKAKKQLLAAGFIIEMRKGKRPNTCSLFALAWRPLNPSPKHDFARFTRVGAQSSLGRLRRPLLKLPCTLASAWLADG